LDALDALWTVNPVRLDGERWSIPESWVNLKPVQRPRPPVYLGAFNPAGLKRVGERADGWMPGVKVPGGVSLDMLRWQRQTIADAARAAGRNPSAIHAYVRVNVAEGTPVDKVTDALQVLADNGYPDAFVDLMYVATGTDACLEWVKRLLPQ
jgi:alkanesulfonate monooxygenase SsuD/methylene tetrahydromethanopterin reductase-like flavin-dependent oxidoreductase (luciferase family)